MVQVAECPNCAQQFRVPGRVLESHVVRCPVCDAEYPFSEIAPGIWQVPDEEGPDEELIVVTPTVADDFAPATETLEDADADLAAGGVPSDEATDAVSEPGLPAGDESQQNHMPARASEQQEPSPEAAEPEAEPVVTGQPGEPSVEQAQQESQATPAAAEKADESVSPQETEPSKAEAVDLQLRCPCCGEPFALSEATLAESGEKVGGQRAELVWVVLSGRGEAGQSEAVSFFPGVVDGSRAGAGRSGQVVDEQAMEFAASLARQRPAEESVTARIAPRGKPKNVVKELCSWVFGGLAGLVIAYYLLVLIRGDAGNFLKIPVLGIPHTYKYSPEWFPGWLRAEPEADPDQGTADPNISHTDGLRDRLFRGPKEPGVPCQTVRLRSHDSRAGLERAGQTPT